MPNFVSNLLLFCSGANRYYLDQCPNERHKFLPIGFSVLITTCLAVIAMLFASFSIFGDHVGDAKLIIFSLFWGLAIFSIDWGLVKTMYKPKKERSFLRELFTVPVLFRLSVAVLISFSISRPLEVAIYEKRLRAQIEIDRQEFIRQERQRITDQNNKNILSPLDSATANLGRIAEQIAAGPQNDSYKENIKALKDCQQEYATLKTNTEKRVAEIYTEIRDIKNNSTNYDTRFNRLTKEAEGRINSRKNTIGRLREAVGRKGAICQTIQTRIEDEKKVHRESFGEAQEINKAKGAIYSEELRKQTMEDSSALKKILENARVSFNPESPGLITSLESMANFEQTPAGRHVWIVRLILLLIFICIDTAPIIVKILTKRGPYENMQEAEEERMQYLAMAEKNANILLISNMATAQNRVLRRAIDEYEAEEIENLERQRTRYREYVQTDNSK